MHTACEWLVILAAYAYEVEDRPIMSDREFDLRCQDIGESSIQGFEPHTGQWVHGLSLDQVARVFATAMSYHPKHKELHIPQVTRALDELKVPYGCCNVDICKWEFLDD